MPIIGVAVAIPEPWASELQDYRRYVGDATATLIPTHITLLPPTEIDDGDLADVEKHLAEVAAEQRCFEVYLRGTGTFRPVSPVVFVTLSEGISQCEQLAASVCQGPLAIDLDFPFHPHVTIAHHVGDAQLDEAFTDLAGFECTFVVEDFHLYVHDPVAGWQPTRDFSLDPALTPDSTAHGDPAPLTRRFEVT